MSKFAFVNAGWRPLRLKTGLPECFYKKNAVVGIIFSVKIWKIQKHGVTLHPLDSSRLSAKEH